ncbi:hypothetical protein DY000_02054060 [Brassica cretica]|uniref:Uncharacterized protein n=1 Tax=Brassica cretica TaxID=69181 RepID=A0ABQ7AHC6_BRACR|nr:hypothetical protein DY000_02054060 [Brassica cretica]
MTTLRSFPSSPRFFATKAPLFFFSILKRCHSLPRRNRINSKNSTYRDGNLHFVFRLANSSLARWWIPKLVVRRDRSLGGKEVVVAVENFGSSSSSLASSGQASRNNSVARTLKLIAQNSLPKWWSASLPRQSLEVDKEDYQREVALMGLMALGDVVTTDLLRISSCRKVRISSCRKVRISSCRKVDPCTGPEKLMRSCQALESLQLTKCCLDDKEGMRASWGIIYFIFVGSLSWTRETLGAS